MINLFYASLLCIVQFLPFSCLASNLDNVSYVDSVSYFDESEYVFNVKQSIDYSNNAYVTNYMQTACLETWQKLETTFGNVFPDFNTETGNINSYTTTVPCSGLYCQVGCFYYYESDYSSMQNYVITNYSNYYVKEIILHNNYFSVWGNEQGVWYNEHRLEFVFNDDTFLDYHIMKGQDSTFDLYIRYYNGSSYVYNQYGFCFFADDNFTYGDCLKVSDIWEATQSQEEFYNNGYQTGYNVGVEVGKTAGETTGYGEGYQDGYQEGLAHADYDSTALTIMQGIVDVGLLPVNVFLMMLNFEVFGVNISGFVSALLTISIVIIIVRFLFGGKSDD